MHLSDFFFAIFSETRGRGWWFLPGFTVGRQTSSEETVSRAHQHQMGAQMTLTCSKSALFLWKLWTSTCHISYREGLGINILCLLEIEQNNLCRNKLQASVPSIKSFILSCCLPLLPLYRIEVLFYMCSICWPLCCCWKNCLLNLRCVQELNGLKPAVIFG